MKHTPTPWTYDSGWLYDSNMNRIANTESSSFVTYKEDLNNLSHIVKCVNMHDELVEALKAQEDLYQIGVLFADASYVSRVTAMRRESLKKAGAL